MTYIIYIIGSGLIFKLIGHKFKGTYKLIAIKKQFSIFLSQNNLDLIFLILIF